jgi:hypothetical protein
VALGRLSAGGLAGLPRSSTWLTGLCAMVDAAWSLGDAGVARQAYDILARFANLPSMPSLAIVCFGSVERSLGLAALTMGQVELAVEHLERAVTANARLGNRPLVAMSRADLARALRRRGAPGDAARAAGELAEAISAAGAMGMTDRAAAWTASAAGPGDADPVARGLVRREGRRWLVALDDRGILVEDLVGMRYLAALVARPGVEVSAFALVSGGEAPAPAAEPQLVLDDEARSAYADRARELLAELDEARDHADIGRAERLQLELEAVTAELTRGTGLHGRRRAFAGPEERARTAVRKAIQRALGEIEMADAEIGGLLRACIRTGYRCCYVPEDSPGVRWQIGSAEAEPPTRGPAVRR